MIKRKKYTDGTKGIKKGPGGDTEKEGPTVVPPKEDTSLDSYTPDIPQVRTSPTGLAKGGSEYVAAYQRKLNSQGANLVVDGAWGKNTQAAFEQYQASQGKGTTSPAPKITPKVPPLPKGDKEFKSVDLGKEGLGKGYRELASFYDKPTPTSSPALKRKLTPPTEFDEAQQPGTSMEDAYSGITYPEATSPKGEKSKVGAGYQFYPNGRMQTPQGKMDTYSRLPKRGIPMDSETVAARKALKAKLVQASDRKW